MSKDHPRSRGEYPELYKNTIAGIGSSPLSRGIQSNVPKLSRSSRIIPALAGNTHTCPSSHGAYKDHPRSRGEYWKKEYNFDYATGSSPLSRGILTKESAPKKVVGIIPALAGNT